ncbi:MAG: extensin family protein [Rhizobiales bacterium]|nr:extensin family protein [Hyphomicrobiales bacterium]
MKRSFGNAVVALCALVLAIQPAAAKARHHPRSLFEQIFAPKAKGKPARKARKKRPRPAASAAPARPAGPALPSEAPEPTPRPDGTGNSGSAGTEAPRQGEVQTVPKDGQAPVPEARPRENAGEPKEGKPALSDPYERGGEGSVGRHNRETAARPDDAERREDTACRSRLKALGVVFAPQEPLSDPAGCSVPFPISVSKLGDIAIDPPAVLNCAMTETIARFTSSVVSPAVRSAYGTNLKSIANASAYVCRPRHGTAKLSEHAFGNALDIGAFGLADGRAIEVKAGVDPRDARFLATVRSAACGPFKTVLGPGSDPDHALHFHLDLAPRRSGATYCH